MEKLSVDPDFSTIGCSNLTQFPGLQFGSFGIDLIHGGGDDQFDITIHSLSSTESNKIRDMF